MKFTIIALGTISFFITITFCNDLPTTLKLPNSREVQIPPKGEFKPLPQGSTIVINNHQTLNTFESRREVQTHVTHPQPPPVIVNTPAPIATNIKPVEAMTQNYNKNSLYGLLSWLKELPNNLFTLQTGAVLAGSAALGYTVLWIKFLQYRSLAKSNDGWGSLQEHVPPQHLLSIPLLSLAEGLIDEIKKKYVVTNLVDSIPLFSQEVEEELEELKSFLTFHEWLDYFKLSFFFPDQKKLIKQATLKMQRLMIFKEAIAQWLNAHSARLIKNIDIPHSPLTFSFEFTQDETDVMELPN